jgi:hypothetical protein
LTFACAKNDGPRSGSNTPDLNRRIVERLQLIQLAKHLTQLARLSVGMTVEFTAHDGRTISGTISRLNRQTATVVTSDSGQWRVSSSLLRTLAHGRPSRVIHMPGRRSGQGDR